MMFAGYDTDDLTDNGIGRILDCFEFEQKN